MEVDRVWRPFLQETLGEYSNLHPLAGYFLKVDIPLWCRQSFRDFVPWPAPTCLLYHLPGPHCPAGGPVLFLCHRHGSEGGGPADGRRPRSGDSSAFTVFCNYYAQPGFSSTCPLLPASAQVTSSVVRLDIRQSPPCPVEDEALFFRVVRASFCPAA